jgi:tRNA A-37 threonylcarbamoyl transferase component Bud32
LNGHFLHHESTSRWSGSLSELVGKKLKDYYILRRLGRGAMAEVYLAQQLSLGRQVALKVLNAELAHDPIYVQRFQHEARAAAALVHAGIVQIYEVGQEDGVHFITQEYVAGRNLGEVIKSRGRLAPGVTLDILRQVAAALSKAASEGIVHRDIKPENIMLARSGEVKVADFGLARAQGNDGLNLTQVGITMGTPLYMSPEQIEGRPLDSRSDIYSLGVTAYHMLSGSPPFEADTPLAVAVQHLNQPPESLEKRQRDVPKSMASVVERMLAKKPADRFADPAALLRELHVLAKQGVEQGWASTSQPWSLPEMIAIADDRAAATSRLGELMTATTRARRFARGWMVAAGIVCLLVGCGLAYWLRPRPLLGDARDGLPARGTVWAQLYHAKNVNTEAAWQAVEKYFPDADIYPRNLAKQGLVYYYLLRSREFEKALGPLHELAARANDPEFHAFGLAGLVVADTKLDHADQAREENSLLTPEMRSLVRDQMPQLDELMQQSLAELGRPGS